MRRLRLSRLQPQFGRVRGRTFLGFRLGLFNRQGIAIGVRRPGLGAG